MAYRKNINQNERRLRELAGAIRSSKNELSLTVKTKNNSDMKEITINTHGDIPNIKSDIIKVLIIAVAILSLQICFTTIKVSELGYCFKTEPQQP